MKWPDRLLATILSHNKLTKSNYIDQKRNIDIVLTAKRFKYVLNTKCPSIPEANATNEEREEYDKWIKVDEMAQC